MLQASGPVARRKKRSFNMQNQLSKTPDHFYEEKFRAPGIYSITCVPTGKTYVGSAVNISLRWRRHFAHLSAGNHHCEHLQRAWKKYGSEAFSFSVMELAPLESLRSREQFHIDAVPEDRRFNSSPTAGSLLGFKMSPDGRERRRAAHLGFRHSEETKARARIARAGICPRPAGWKHSLEAKQKVSAALSGKPLSPERREKSAAQLRKINTIPKTEKQRIAIAERKRRLSDSQVAVVRQMYLAGDSMPTIAAALQFGDRKTIGRAIRGVGIYGTIGEPIVSLVARPLSEAHKQKVGAFHKGRPKSAETLERMRVAQSARRAREAAGCA